MSEAHQIVTMENNPPSETVLVTGGAGFIGSHTVELLLSAGHKVIVLDNLSTGDINNLPTSQKLTFLQGDICDLTMVTQAMIGVDRVLHLAAIVSVQASIADPLASSKTNISGFLNVLNAAYHGKAKRFVYSSSAAVYGQPDQLPLNEFSTIKPISPYGLEKSINDSYGQLYKTLYGLSTLGLRYFNVYGPRQKADSPYAGVLAKFIDRLQAGLPLIVHGTGEQSRDFIHVKDVAQANLRALFCEYSGVLNIGNGRSTSLNEAITILRSMWGQEIITQHIHAAPGDILHSHTENTLQQKVLGEITTTPLAQGLASLLKLAQ